MDHVRGATSRIAARFWRERASLWTCTRATAGNGYESLIPALELPDPNDRHALAAAIVGRCDVIVTRNLRHFPEETLAYYGTDALHPDDFLSSQLNLARRGCSARRFGRSGRA